jgi:DNA-binding winged helix-turn-helix (wHTH) protein/predicted ATPase
MLAFGSFRLDLKNEQLWSCDRSIKIQPKTFAVLRYLAERPELLITKRELLDALWGDISVGDAVLKTHLKEIRRALNDTAKAPRFVQTVHCRGYRFIAAVRRCTESGLTQRPAPARAAGPDLIGREAAFVALRGAMAEVRQGERRVLFVTGEPGIGKTALVSAFLAELQTCDDVWLACGQCIEQYGAGATHLPVLEALGTLARGPEAPRVIEILRQFAPSWLGQLPEVSPARAAASIATPERLLREFAEAALALGRLRALVWVLEDLHWADYSTLDLLSYLAQRSDSARILILGTFRPVEARAAGHPLWTIQQNLQIHEQCEELALHGLTERDIARYLDSRFARHALPAALARLLHERTSGNPLFVARVVDSLIRSNALVQTDGVWFLDTELEQMTESVPASIVSLIERDVERLTAFERALLEAASVFGMEFSSAAVAQALNADVLPVEELLARWARQGRFLRVADERAGLLRCRFMHALYRQVIYQGIGPGRAARLHRLAGKHLETQAGEARAAVLALHFEHALDVQRAVRYRRLAGEQALRQSAPSEAISHFKQGLALCRSLEPGEQARVELEIRVALGVPLAMVLGYAAPEVERAYVRAAELCTRIGETLLSFPVMSGLATFYVMRGRYEKSLALGAQFLALAQRQGDRGAELEANVVLGTSCVYLGKLGAALAHFDQVLMLYDRERQASHRYVYQQDAYVTAHFYQAWVFWLMGYADKALASAREGLRFAEERVDPFAIATAIFNLGHIHQWRREHDAAKNQAKALARLCREHGFQFLLATATELEGAALVHVGELEAGLALVRSGWAAHQATGAELGRTYWRAVLAEACLRSGLVVEAGQVLAEAFEFADQHAEHCWEPELYRLYAELCLKAPEYAPRLGGVGGHRLSVATALAKALEMARRTGAKALELRAALSTARLWASQGKVADMPQLLRPLCDWFIEGRTSADLAEARALLAACASPSPASCRAERAATA